MGAEHRVVLRHREVADAGIVDELHTGNRPRGCLGFLWRTGVVVSAGHQDHWALAGIDLRLRSVTGAAAALEEMDRRLDPVGVDDLAPRLETGLEGHDPGLRQGDLDRL